MPKKETCASLALMLAAMAAMLIIAAYDELTKIFRRRQHDDHRTT